MTTKNIFITPKQAAEMLNVKRAYFTQHAQDLGIDCMQTKGGHRRYSLEEVQEAAKKVDALRHVDTALFGVITFSK